MLIKIPVAFFMTSSIKEAERGFLFLEPLLIVVFSVPTVTKLQHLQQQR